LGALLAFVSALRQPVEYISHARMVVSGRVNLPDASSAYSEELANYLGTQAEIMRSQEVISRARQRVQLERPGLQGNAHLEIRILPGTSIFTLSATDAHADYCRAFLDAVMHEFTHFKRERRMVTSQATIEQISSELARLEQETNAQEQALLRFKEQNNISFWEQQALSSARLLADLKAREAALRMQLRMMDTWEQISTERGLSGHAEIGESGTISIAELPELSQARQKVDMLAIERDELLRGLRPIHPKVLRLNDEIARQEKIIAFSTRKLTERRKERRAAMQSELEGLAKSIAEWDAKSIESSRIEGEYQKIRSSLARSQDLYSRMLTSLQNLDTRKGVDQELVQILQAASPAQPVDLRVRSRVISGLITGMILSAGLLVLAVRLDDRSYSVEETVDRLGCRSFVEVPQRPSGPVSSGRRKFIESTFEESFRRLRSLVVLGLPADQAPIFLVTSALPSEGKSEVAINLARSFARVGRRVLLVDADLRRGRIHRALEAGDIKRGFHEFLDGTVTEDEIIRGTTEPNLSLITAGYSSTHASEVLSTTDLSARLASLARRFDVVVIDSAPIGPVDDTNHLVPFASRVLFVIRMRHTPIRQAIKAISTLKVRGARDVGLVFNRVQQEGSSYYYSYHKK
jgi:capsular exopolysaccharide synthesis family protein